MLINAGIIMPITSISIQNYKSLRSVSISPKPLSVIVGANASGKTNFADCLDFIGEVYRHGLEVAVSRKGGYENIAFRRQQRSKLPIRVQLIIELSAQDRISLMDLPQPRMENPNDLPNLRVEHTFEFVASTTSIRAQFSVTQEELIMSEWADGNWHTMVSMNRKNNELTVESEAAQADRSARQRHGRSITFTDLLRYFSDLEVYSKRLEQFSSAELIGVAVGRFTFSLQSFLRAAQSIKVFQISPMKSREVGVPTPSPELERSGGNLPAVVDDMQRNKPEAWASVMEVMRAIMPDLKSIEVDYTSSKRLGLFFREEGYRRSWSVEEVSDGTLQTLALLFAIFDPGSYALVLEELENSVHPWIIRRVIDACRQASASKQIILTTHSPIVINAMAPEEVWVIWRENGESHLEQLSNLNQELLSMWARGMISTFEYIDSGGLPVALPPAPSDTEAFATLTK